MPEYSQNVDLKKRGNHERILQAILARYRASEQQMSSYYDDFEEAEEQQTSYIHETDVDALRRNDREQKGKLDYTTVIIPYDYATALSAHTYWSSVFLGRAPVFQFQGRHGEGEQQVQAVEALVDYQAQVGGWLPPLYVWLYDAATYPFAVICNFWDEEWVNIPIIKEVQEYMDDGLPIEGKTKKVKETSKRKGYVGNKLFNVRPYDWFPDHRKPILSFQDGEYCGRRAKMGWNDLVRRKERGIYTNLDEVERRRAKDSYGEYHSHVKELPDDDEVRDISTSDIRDVGSVDILEFYVEIIPKRWKLGESGSPEMWRFTVAGEEVVIEARPMGNMHGKFPFNVLPYDFEGHAFMGRSIYKIMRPMTEALNWLINSHIYNVRAILNNKLVYDPLRVVEKDVLSGDARGIRLKPEAYGTDVRSAIHQLQVGDATQSHVRDAQMFVEMIQRATGVVDPVMGMTNTGGRKTATEIRTSSTMGINRLKTIAEWWSAAGWAPMAQMLLQNTQQYYDGEQKLKIVGDLPPNMEPFLQVNEESIMGFYDFVPVDGALPVDRFAQANTWREMLNTMRQMPMIGMDYDIGGIFAWVAQLAGLKNIKQFRLSPMEKEKMQNEVDRGNLVPVPGGGGGPAKRGRDVNAPPRVSQPSQVSGMGSTG